MTAVQNLFIVSSRLERLRNKQSDTEFESTLRIFNPKTLVWIIFYGCTGETIRLTARKVGKVIIPTENITEEMRWVFSIIPTSAFQWRKERLNVQGERRIRARVKTN